MSTDRYGNPHPPFGFSDFLRIQKLKVFCALGGTSLNQVKTFWKIIVSNAGVLKRLRTPKGIDCSDVPTIEMVCLFLSLDARRILAT